MKTQKKQNLLVISSYPERGKIHGKGTVGIASYAKNTLLAIKSVSKKLSITVLAEKLTQEETYTDNTITVKRVWERGTILAFSNILREVIKQKNTKNVFIEFELAMFGKELSLILFPIFLFILKMLRKDITIALHQVVPDFREMHGHVNLKKDSLRISFYNFAVRMFYRLLLLFVDRAIVFDEALKDQLKRFGNTRKISVIPHGVEAFKSNITKTKAREKLKISRNTFVVLSFGFLAWYKGTDWLVEELKKINEKTSPSPSPVKRGKKTNSFSHREKVRMRAKRIHLILAGGPNPNHMDKEFYKKYISEIEKKCEEASFMVTGFVKEGDIPLYYGASDIVILPYRTFMSASGPLSIAMSLKKPFLVSESLRAVFKTRDIADTLETLRLSKEHLIFSQNGDLERKLRIFDRNSLLYKKAVKLADHMRSLRSWNHIGKQYYQELSLR